MYIYTHTHTHASTCSQVRRSLKRTQPLDNFGKSKRTRLGTYQIYFSGQPNPWRKSCDVDSCCADRVYMFSGAAVAEADVRPLHREPGAPAARGARVE